MCLARRLREAQRAVRGSTVSEHRSPSTQPGASNSAGAGGSAGSVRAVAQSFIRNFCIIAHIDQPMRHQQAGFSSCRQDGIHFVGLLFQERGNH